ncbi:glycosyl transferase family 90-domain-containing protein [Mrakia frigida]|uniref:glycosyl transferase family 90-domain-containing protein n=1 Tax=Mrakia frigida TaxID=29902 RepID=UPI003FCC1A63
MFHIPSIPWRLSHRSRLALITNGNSSWEAPSRIVISPRIDPVTGRTMMRRTLVSGIGLGDWNKWFYDIKFTGRALQCEGGEGDQVGNGAGGTCAEMREELPFAPHQSMDELNKYKYMIDVDGNSWSARFRRLMSTNSLVIKATVYPEWYSEALIPWFHYVPIKTDYSDMYDTLAFFRGTPDHPGGFDDVAKHIARNGKCFVKKLWRREDLQAYMFLLYLELARLLSLKRTSGAMDLPSLTPLPAL